MNAKIPVPSVLERLNLGGMDAKDALLDALARYRADPLFCVPAKAREIAARRGKESSFVLLGTKDFAAVFISALAGKGRILNVVDDFKSHRGERFHGVDIVSTDKFLEIARGDPDVIALNCCRFDYSRRFFEDLCRHRGIPVLNHEQVMRLLDLNGTADHRVADWGECISARFDEFMALEKRLADPYSIETLRGVLTFHLTGNPEWHLNISRPYSSLYFRSGLFSLSDRERFVDCGASIGESTLGLAGVTGGRFAHSWMIEPDRFNVETLLKLQRRFAGSAMEAKLSLHPVAVGESVAEAPFHHQGGHSGSIALADPEARLEKVSVKPVDMVIDDVPTFIKMDIEGFELAALKGAVNAIQAGKPKLALSAYHRATDLLDLPAFIDSVAPGYTLGLRHHTEDRWDTCLYFYR